MLSDELIAKIGDSLDAMPPKPASRRELDVLVSRIEGKIRAAQERGATYAEIAKQISESGYPIKANALRIAVQRRRRQRSDIKEQGRRTAARRKPPQARNGGAVRRAAAGIETDMKLQWALLRRSGARDTRRMRAWIGRGRSAREMDEPSRGGEAARDRVDRVPAEEHGDDQRNRRIRGSGMAFADDVDRPVSSHRPE